VAAATVTVEPVESGTIRGAPTTDAALVRALRRGDEAVFAALVHELGPSLLRVARLYVSTTAVAEEVVQEAWLGLLNGLDRFEGRSSLKTWLFRILVNRAKTRGEREGRSVPFASLTAEVEDDEPAVEADRFASGGRWAGHWTSSPLRFDELPEERVLAAETRLVVERALAELPPSQRAVVTLRDVEGWTAEEVRNVLDLSETNQRVLLHRGRSRVRQALERYLNESEHA
jgi:RNA polymerase sigma-70 factor (ECF subfamily)